MILILAAYRLGAPYRHTDTHTHVPDLLSNSSSEGYEDLALQRLQLTLDFRRLSRSLKITKAQRDRSRREQANVRTTEAWMAGQATEAWSSAGEVAGGGRSKGGFRSWGRGRQTGQPTLLGRVE